MTYAPKMICEKCGNYSMAYRNLQGLKEKDICKCEPLFTKADVEAMRIETLEKAAKVCEEALQNTTDAKSMLKADEVIEKAVASGAMYQAEKLAAAIRGMK